MDAGREQLTLIPIVILFKTDTDLNDIAGWSNNQSRSKSTTWPILKFNAIFKRNGNDKVAQRTAIILRKGFSKVENLVHCLNPKSSKRLPGDLTITENKLSFSDLTCWPQCVPLSILGAVVNSMSCWAGSSFLPWCTGAQQDYVNTTIETLQWNLCKYLENTRG